jgi:hypothetical protein
MCTMIVRSSASGDEDIRWVGVTLRISVALAATDVCFAMRLECFAPKDMKKCQHSSDHDGDIYELEHACGDPN